MVNRELEDSNYSEEVRNGRKEARCNWLRNVEEDLLRVIEGNGWQWWNLGYMDTSLQNDALFYSVFNL
jgi:hypothetical protein